MTARIQVTTEELQAHKSQLEAKKGELDSIKSNFISQLNNMEDQIRAVQASVKGLLESWISSSASGAYDALQADWNSHASQLQSQILDVVQTQFTAMNNDLEQIAVRVGNAATNYDEGEQAVTSAIGH